MYPKTYSKSTNFQDLFTVWRDWNNFLILTFIFLHLEYTLPNLSVCLHSYRTYSLGEEFMSILTKKMVFSLSKCYNYTSLLQGQNPREVFFILKIFNPTNINTIFHDSIKVAFFIKFFLCFSICLCQSHCTSFWRQGLLSEESYFYTDRESSS